MPLTPIASAGRRLYNEDVHEMAITQSVIEAVAERSGGRPVTRVTLVIGTLSGVVADSVRFCFDLATSGTALEGATLEIVEVRGRARCRDCGDEVELPDFLALCTCGSADLEILAGEELTVASAEVAA
ncbi:MAG TPA: hydrogenase maturation nickel metallochaperone HypA [Acidimicrobiales bacterium]